MTHGSLFSGIGGFDLAAQWIGWKNIFHCEINPFCQKILNHYWPNAKSYTDIKQTDFSIYRGKIDVLSGGFPCQPFSTAGRRKGAEDDRYLWPEMLRAIDEIRPTWVVGENVAGLASMVQPEAYKTEVESQINIQGEVDQEAILEYQQYVTETVCSDLEHLGYSVQTIIIPACAVGAPHRRDRIWFIANRSDAGTESMPGQEDSVYRFNSFTNAYSIRGKGRAADCERENENETLRSNLYQQINGLSIQRTTSDTSSDRRNRERSGAEDENREKESLFLRIMEGRSEGLCFQKYTSDSHDKRLQAECFPFSNESKRRKKSDGYVEQYSSHDWRTLPTERWEKFPTKSPVCGGNDGVSSGLDGITFPKWREESIKAYGNAVVPQVVFEIFKGINEIDHDHQH
ncbi:DNA cytosine methyltransferase [Sphingobacterium multivorum]|uniref:DNA cytosine methyltransferase n=1 Tax=Sphingobacterium multivorum TaxID=28454 RepID=UPI003DA5DCA4